MAFWTSAAALLGIVSFAAAVFGLLSIEAEEHQGPDLGISDDDGEGVQEEVGEEVLWAMLLAAPPSVGLVICMTFWVSRRAFGPLRAVTRAAGEITAADLGRRLDVEDGDQDLGDLVRAFNALLARLDAAVGALDRYAADVSHEIRTPLAVAITELEVTLRGRPAAEEWNAQAARTLEDLRGLADVADGLLQLARTTSGAGLPRARFELVQALRPVITRAAAAASRQDFVFSFDIADDVRAVEVAGSAPLVRGAVGNVVDNALKHAHAPGEIRLRIEAGEGTVRVVVEDSGPGIPEDVRRWVFEPFARAVPPGGTVDGVGLGLAVANRSVTAHGGTISTGPSSLGGASFVIELPSVSRGPSA